MTPLKNDRGLLRKRMQAGLDQLLSQADVSLDTSKIATFGFCFGGCCSLELARTGAELKAAISFHGTLDTPNPADAKTSRARCWSCTAPLTLWCRKSNCRLSKTR